MNNSELDKLLKSEAVPDRPREYWDQFPKKTLVAARSRLGGATAARDRDVAVKARERWSWAAVLRPRWALPGAGLAAACLVVLALGLWRREQPASPHSGFGEQQVAKAQKYYREIEDMFPNQVRAIVFDQQGTHLMLADGADIPPSPPLLVKICGRAGCQQFITFSGQQIRVNGELCDVLVDRNGGVILSGQGLFWSSETASETNPSLKIEARRLGLTS